MLALERLLKRFLQFNGNTITPDTAPLIALRIVANGATFHFEDKNAFLRMGDDKVSFAITRSSQIINALPSRTMKDSVGVVQTSSKKGVEFTLCLTDRFPIELFGMHFRH